jgi:hypothetical protein
LIQSIFVQLLNLSCRIFGLQLWVNSLHSLDKMHRTSGRMYNKFNVNIVRLY